MTKQTSRRTAVIAIAAFAIISAVSICGCVFVNSGSPGVVSGVFGPDGLPLHKYLVGGGMMIEWKAPQDGTAYLVLTGRPAKKIIKTEHLEKGSVFSIEGPPAGEELAKFEEMFGVKLADAKFSLYFVPSAKPDEK